MKHVSAETSSHRRWHGVKRWLDTMGNGGIRASRLLTQCCLHAGDLFT